MIRSSSLKVVPHVSLEMSDEKIELSFSKENIKIIKDMNIKEDNLLNLRESSIHNLP